MPAEARHFIVVSSKWKKSGTDEHIPYEKSCCGGSHRCLRVRRSGLQAPQSQSRSDRGGSSADGVGDPYGRSKSGEPARKWFLRRRAKCVALGSEEVFPRAAAADERPAEGRDALAQIHRAGRGDCQTTERNP